MSGKNGHHEQEYAEGSISAEDAEKEALADAMRDEELAASLEAASQEAKQEAGSGFSDPLEALAAENHKLDEEIADLKDKLLRGVAEMENLRRRTQKDVADARAYSIAGFARDILGVADNLRRAIEHVDEKDKEQSGLKSLVEGVEMTERELLSVLERNGVRKISPANEKFDPNFHQAMLRYPIRKCPTTPWLRWPRTGS